jgi:hypothetical protein
VLCGARPAQFGRLLPPRDSNQGYKSSNDVSRLCASANRGFSTNAAKSQTLVNLVNAGGLMHSTRLQPRLFRANQRIYSRSDRIYETYRTDRRIFARD